MRTLLLALFLFCLAAPYAACAADTPPVLDETEESTTYLMDVRSIPEENVSSPKPVPGCLFLVYRTEEVLHKNNLLYDRFITTAVMQLIPVVPGAAPAVVPHGVWVSPVPKPRETSANPADGNGSPYNNSLEEALRTLEAEQSDPSEQPMPEPTEYTIYIRREGGDGYLGGAHAMHSDRSPLWLERGTTSGDTPEACVWENWKERGMP